MQPIKNKIRRKTPRVKGGSSSGDIKSWRIKGTRKYVLGRINESTLNIAGGVRRRRRPYASAPKTKTTTTFFRSMYNIIYINV